MEILLSELQMRGPSLHVRIRVLTVLHTGEELLMADYGYVKKMIAKETHLLRILNAAPMPDPALVMKSQNMGRKCHSKFR